MPELPEVQTVVDRLKQARIVGRTITGARVFWPKTIAGMDSRLFRDAIRGLVIERLSRRGKYIVVDLSKGLTLLVHLRMTGRLTLTDHSTDRNSHEHVILDLDQAQQLRFQDTRKFGRITLTSAPQAILEKLGIEPLSPAFTARHMLAILQRHHRRLKPLLLDQHVIAGLGNIYVDEALWTAGLHPLRISSDLDSDDAGRLHRAIRRVLRKGIKNLGTSLGTGKGNFRSADNRLGRNAGQLNVFRRTGMACPRCKTTIERLIVGQRSSHVCPRCQPTEKGSSNKKVDQDRQHQ